MVWGNACKTFLSKLDRLQNAAGKIILGLPRRYPTELLLNTLGWQKLHDRRSNHLNVMVYKSLTCKLPTNLCNIFNHVHDTHNHLTRACSQGNLVPPRCKNNSDNRKFTYRGSTSFNDLPTTAKSPLPSSIGAFKHILSQNCFLMIFTLCAIPSIFKRIFIFITLLMHVCIYSWSGQCNISSCFVFLFCI